MNAVMIMVASVVGAVLASLLACVPGLHVYNVLAAGLVALPLLAAHGVIVPPDALVAGTAGMIVGFSMANTIPSVFLAAPDESAVFTVLPGQKYLMLGRGYEAVMLTAAGGLGATFVLVLGVGLFGGPLLRLAREVMQPHFHWMVWCVIAFMLLAEWPKGGRLGQAGWTKFASAWRSTGAGLLTFLLSGLLGFILFLRSPLPVDMAAQNLMPAFAGLFTLPWLVLNLVSHVTSPPQRLTAPTGLDVRVLTRGTLAGVLGGGFAAFVPAVTGGVGGMLAGHATALRDDRSFLVSQGASKLVYYAGGFLLFFVPYLHMTRGGAAWMLRSVAVPGEEREFLGVLAAIAMAGAVSFWLLDPLTRATIRLIGRWGSRRISVAALGVVLALVLLFTGWPGFAVALTGLGIGLIPLLYGSRRMNCLGVILLPVACNLSGLGPAVASLLGL